MVKKWLSRLWNTEFEIGKPYYAVFALLVVLVVGLWYPVVEVLFTMHSEFNLPHYLQAIKGNNPDVGFGYYVHIWLVVAALCIIFRYGIIVDSYFKTLKTHNPDKFRRDFVVYFTAIVTALAVNLLVLAIAGGMFWSAGYTFAHGFHFAERVVQGLYHWVNNHIPTLFNVKFYPLALLLALVLSSLPEYFVHRLAHTSRFVWYVFHQPHHAAEILHPMANAPAYLFDFFLALPRGVVFIIIGKIVYTQPMLFEGSMYFLLSYFIEIFNHSGVHYTTAYKNRVLRFLCDITGGGIYHFLHHSSAQEHQMANLTGGPFCLWDRIFGTYAEPPAQTPQVGLTHNPPIVMNPLRILYGGLAKILYELKANRSFKTRFWVVFGSVNYVPPITTEFVKQHRAN
ncbi:MAG TPA: sterol desaturase family protein [Chitinophagales bacterium]|nr:sterol desaturase family protein [Chitinophagales bacterium]HRK26239.1 sterol desaturase family protein [Chitinophagales bacterium]